MKSPARIWLLGIVPLLTSCAFKPITLAPVGPKPGPGEYAVSGAGEGQLEVFTQTEETDMNRDVPYYPHRDYRILTMDGKHLKRVWNHQDREDETPAVVTLPAGEYLVKADAALYGLVEVPVVIKPNQLTRVILQPGWKPGTEVAESSLVRLPDGYPVGWRAQSPEQR